MTSTLPVYGAELDCVHKGQLDTTENNEKMKTRKLPKIPGLNDVRGSRERQTLDFRTITRQRL